MTDLESRCGQTPGPIAAQPCLPGDLLEGAEAIAEFFYGDRSKRRKIYHLAETSRLPVFRMGAVLCARKSTILTWIEKQERAGIEACSDL